MKIRQTLVGILLSASLFAGCASQSQPRLVKLMDMPKAVKVAKDTLEYMHYREIKEDFQKGSKTGSVSGIKNVKMKDSEKRRYKADIGVEETSMGHDFSVSVHYSSADSPDVEKGDLYEKILVLSLLKAGYDGQVRLERLDRMSYEDMIREGLIPSR